MTVTLCIYRPDAAAPHMDTRATIGRARERARRLHSAAAMSEPNAARSGRATRAAAARGQCCAHRAAALPHANTISTHAHSRPAHATRDKRAGGDDRGIGRQRRRKRRGGGGDQRALQRRPTARPACQKHPRLAVANEHADLCTRSQALAGAAGEGGESPGKGMERARARRRGPCRNRVRAPRG